MSKKVKIITTFDITDEFFKSKKWNEFKEGTNEFQKEMVKDINTSTIYPGCSNAKVELIVE